MSHIYRFVAEFQENSWKILADELKHLKRVLRLKEGDAVEVFDGCGHSAIGVLSSINSQEAVVSGAGSSDIITVTENACKQKLIICAGALKSGLLDDLLPGLVELGVDQVHVFLQDSNAKSRINEKSLQRWDRIILASSKQCKRSWLTTIKVWKNLETLLSEADLAEIGNRLVLQPNVPSTILGVELDSSSVIAVVGGEKGLDQKELKFLGDSQFKEVSMGPHILRAVTALTASSAILSVRIKTPAIK